MITGIHKGSVTGKQEGGSTPATPYLLIVNKLNGGDRSVCKKRSYPLKDSFFFYCNKFNYVVLLNS